MSGLSHKAVIAGIGATDFSKDSGRSELRLAAEAVTAALEDAGLTPADVDGLTSFTMDTNTEAAVARSVGIPNLKFFSRLPAWIVDPGGVRRHARTAVYARVRRHE